MITAFYSDPHFGHKNICAYAERPFVSVDEMNSVLIERYNYRIGENDTVLWLGDAFLCHFDKAKMIMDTLNGKKILIDGNHDRSVKQMCEIGFDLVMHQAALYISGRNCHFCHYPYAGTEHVHGKDDRFVEKRPVRRKGEILIHGHTHTRRKVHENMIHVGVDAWNFEPVMYNELVELMEKHFSVK